jgi:hypothetical protein
VLNIVHKKKKKSKKIPPFKRKIFANKMWLIDSTCKMGMKATVGRVLDGTADKGDAETSGSGSGTSGIQGDETNILILLFLYILQGIPLGLAGAIPLILTNRNVRLVPLQYGTVCLLRNALNCDQ